MDSIAGTMAKRSDAAVAAHEPYLQIGEVAERTGVTQRTLRFYEEKGLLKPPTRMEGGFRLYSEDDIERVEQIKRLQQLLGFTLAEIKEMVDAEEVKMQLKAEYRPEAALSEKQDQLLKAIEVTERQYELIQQKVTGLNEMKSHLEERLVTFRGWMDHLEQALTEERKSKAKARV
jgi:DNA-binding transcriptional MerR regulator